MKIVVDLDSVRETARLLDGVADEYMAIASSLRHRHGLQGVTGPHRHSVFATLDWTSSRLTSVADAHRRSAADLRMRVERASERRTSPIYAGIATAAGPAIDTGAVALDRDGDGVTDAYAIDRDGDGRHETFVADTDGDGRFDTAFEMDETGELRAASFDADGDGHAEGFLAVTGSGVVRLNDSDLDGYHERVSWDSPPAHSQPTIMTSSRPGFDVGVDPNARSTPLSLTIGANQPVNSGWSTTIDPGAARRAESALNLSPGTLVHFGTSSVIVDTSGFGPGGAVAVDTAYRPTGIGVKGQPSLRFPAKGGSSFLDLAHSTSDPRVQAALINMQGIEDSGTSRVIETLFYQRDDIDTDLDGTFDAYDPRPTDWDVR